MNKAVGTPSGETKQLGDVLEKNPSASGGDDDSYPYDVGSSEPGYTSGGDSPPSGGTDSTDQPSGAGDPDHDAVADAPDGDSSGEAPDAETPAEPPVVDDLATQPEHTKPGIPPEHKVSIDIEAMARLVTAMERASEQIVGFRGELRAILDGVRLDTSEVSRFDHVSAWIDDELPGLRRRLALAQDIEGGGHGTTPGVPRPPVYQPYVGDESRIPTCPPGESRDNGRDAARRLVRPAGGDTDRDDGDGMADVIARLTAGKHDPYFAREFVHATDPRAIVQAVLDAAGSADPAAHEQLVELTAGTVATASRGTGQLAPPEGDEEQWAALREDDDPATAELAARLHPAP